MMRWDWVDDTSADLRREQKRWRRLRRQQRIVAADAMSEDGSAAASEEAGMEDADMAQDARPHERENDVVLGVDEDEEAEEGVGPHGPPINLDSSDDDSSDAVGDADDSDSDVSDAASSSGASEEYAWGDHVSSRNAFVYEDQESSDSDGPALAEEAVGMRTRRRSALLRARRSILHFLRSD